eukprot:3005479-Prymnesium_polylepis.1
MQKSELRAFIVRAEAVAKLTARYCILLNLDFEGIFDACYLDTFVAVARATKPPRAAGQEKGGGRSCPVPGVPLGTRARSPATSMRQSSKAGPKRGSNACSPGRSCGPRASACLARSPPHHSPTGDGAAIEMATVWQAQPRGGRRTRASSARRGWCLPLPVAV